MQPYSDLSGQIGTNKTATQYTLCPGRVIAGVFFIAFVLILPLGGTPSGERRALCRRFIRAHRLDTSVLGISTNLRPVVVLLPLNGGRPWRDHYLTDLHITSCYQSVCVIGSVTHLVANHGQRCLSLTGS